ATGDRRQATGDRRQATGDAWSSPVALSPVALSPVALSPVALSPVASRYLFAMATILALDEGTTGATALVIGPGGAVLGRGYREIPQHFPRPAWVEHDPEDLFQAVVAAGRDAIAASG